MHIEYDDGNAIDNDRDRVKVCTPRGRARGFYVHVHADLGDECEHLLPLGFMKTSEIEPLESLLNKLVELAQAEI